MTGTVQEEDCDGLCWQYIIEESRIRPKFVVSTEPTDNGIYRGHRGRMEIRVEVHGRLVPRLGAERGDNAIYKMAEILLEHPGPQRRLLANDFLGKGTVTTSEIFFTSPSPCAVADSCAISLDRRLTEGETWQVAIKEIEALPSVEKHGATVSLYNYEARPGPAWSIGQECYFPTWVIPEDSPEVRAAGRCPRAMYGEPRIDKWTFSTNGVAIAGGTAFRSSVSARARRRRPTRRTRSTGRTTS